MKKHWRILGSVALVSFLLWRIDWGQVEAAFAHMSLSMWVAALAVYLFAQVISVLRWYMLARKLGLGGSGWQYLSYYFTGMFFNLALPTSVGGDVVRVWYLSRQTGPSPAGGRRSAAFLSVFADRVNGLAVLIALACAAALFCPLPLPRWILGTVALMGCATVAGLVVLPLLPQLQRLMPGWGRLQRLVTGAIQCWQAREVMLTITLLSVVVQAANVLLAWVLGQALELPVPALYYGVLIPLVSLLTMLPLSVNGMGLREAGTVLLLAPLGVDPAEAVTLSLLLFAVYTSASLVGAVFYLSGRLPRFQAAAASALGDDKGAASARPGTEAPDDADPVRDHSHQGRTGQPPTAA
jgi:uncharacterized membrane protein YbhN (UPF0104 family)